MRVCYVGLSITWESIIFFSCSDLGFLSDFCLLNWLLVVESIWGKTVSNTICTIRTWSLPLCKQLASSKCRKLSMTSVMMMRTYALNMWIASSMNRSRKLLMMKLIQITRFIKNRNKLTITLSKFAWPLLLYQLYWVLIVVCKGIIVIFLIFYYNLILVVWYWAIIIYNIWIFNAVIIEGHVFFVEAWLVLLLLLFFFGELQIFYTYFFRLHLDLLWWLLIWSFC